MSCRYIITTVNSIFLLTLFLSTEIMGISPNGYDENDNFCSSHQSIPEYANHLKKYVDIIPAEGSCSAVVCSQCGDVWDEEIPASFAFPALQDNEDSLDENNTIFSTFMCECKYAQCHRAYNHYNEALQVKWLRTWTRCDGRGIHIKYFRRNFRKYFRFFEQQLIYSAKNTACCCFWPEASEKALKINKMAYQLFRKLFEETAFAELAENAMQKKFFRYEPDFTTHGLTLACTRLCFRFSDYYQVCRELEEFSENNYDERSHLAIRCHLDTILEQLCTPFLIMYDSCLSEHYSEEIEQERELITLLLGGARYVKNIRGSLLIERHPQRHCLQERVYKKVRSQKKTSFHSHKSRQPISRDMAFRKNDYERNENWFFSHLYLLQGICLNEALQYKAAIHAFTKSIEQNSTSRDAYIERALAYFELGDLNSALRDYELAKKFTSRAPPLPKRLIKGFDSYLEYMPQDKSAYASGLAKGGLDGLVEGGKEFIPSTLSSLRGMAQGLWAFARDPNGVSIELANACIACVNFVCTHSTSESLQLIVPELKELIETWNIISDYEKGQRTGFLIGKYGVDIFGCTAAVKGIKYYRDLRRANAFYTLENCCMSQGQRQVIETISTQCSHQRIEYFTRVKIDPDKQGKHIIGHRNFISERNKSIFEHPCPEALLKKYAGTGTPKGNHLPGRAGYKEVVDFGEQIGFYVEQETGAKVPTTRGTIHYDRNNGAHIVPASPKTIHRTE